MNRIIRTTTSLLLLLGSLLTINAQNNNYDFSTRQPGYWIFGLNGGLAYQQADVPTTPEGFGLGLTLGKNLLYQPNSLSIDLRGRLLYGQTYGLGDVQSSGIQNNAALNGTNGLDYRQTPGFVFHNNKTTIGELALEGVINFEGLRQKNNIHLALFGGIGLDYYNAKINQKNGNDLYDYSSISQGSNIRNDLRNNILDDDYETAADGFADGGTIDFMPSLGVELGYWFSPRFAATLGHRATWTRSDIFDGQQWDNNNMSTGNNDLYHYTSLGLRWIIDPGKTRQLRTPIINVLQPYGSPSNTNISTSVVRANIKHINSAMDVELLVNGQNTRFDFFDKQLSSVLNLNEGRNTVVIKATNSGGTTQENLVVIYTKEDVVSPPPPPPVVEARYPQVEITRPATESMTTEEDRITVEANIREVPGRNDINFYINDIRSSDFTYSESTGRFSSNVRLNDGRNDIRIVVGNNAGRATDEVTIYLQTRSLRPVVRITRPDNSPYRTESRRVRVIADIDHVDNRDDIRFTVNGRSTDRFDFSTFDDRFSTEIDLQEGRNTLVISARNNGGEDRDEVVINYEPYVAPTPRMNPPRVTISSVSQPTNNPYRANECTTSVTATILNVTSKSDINFLVNGRRNTNFSFDSRRKVLRSEIRLDRERNEIIIEARNPEGNDRDRAYAECISRPKVEAPVITISSPRNNARTTRNTSSIKATILNVENSRDIGFYINGRQNNNFNFDRRSKVLTATVNLRSGNNTISIRGQNGAGRDEASVNINYQREVIATTRQRPTVEINTPRSNTTVKNPTINLRARTKHIARKSEVTLSVNGRNITSFNYSPITKEVTSSLSLNEGRNTIVIRVRNSDGEAQDSKVVTYNKPVVQIPQPLINITLPSNNTTTDRNRAVIKATVSNATNKEINLTVNGKQEPYFQMKGNQLTANILLTKGRNIIRITASTKGGTANDEVTINYQLAQAPLPIVQFISPSARRKIYSNAKLSIKVGIENVTSGSDISLLVNGKKQEAFDFDLKAKTLTAEIIMTNGSNAILVEANNKAGKASDELKVTYRPRISTTKTDIPKTKTPDRDVAKPTIRIISVGQPTVNPFSPNTARSTILATITSVSKKENITLTVNGKASTDFTFNDKTGEFRSNIPLKRGKNSFTIKATNSLGSEEVTKEVNY